MKLRQPYGYDLAEASDESATVNLLPSLTVQDDLMDSDINVIVARFGLTGHLPNNVRVPQYGDFTGVTDYQSAVQAVRDADSAFLELPPDIRAKFNNNPQHLLEFAAQPLNNEQMYQLGLAERPLPEADKPPKEA